VFFFLFFSMLGCKKMQKRPVATVFFTFFNTEIDENHSFLTHFCFFFDRYGRFLEHLFPAMRDYMFRAPFFLY
jgi:hypothetical protein